MKALWNEVKGDWFFWSFALAIAITVVELLFF